MPNDSVTAPPPARPQKVKCDCGRHFKSNEALQQHRNDSPNHPESHNDSPNSPGPSRQAPGIWCPCGKRVRNKHGLNQHRLTSQTHKHFEQFCASFGQREELGLALSPGYDGIFLPNPDVPLYRQPPIRFEPAAAVGEGQAGKTKTKKNRQKSRGGNYGGSHGGSYGGSHRGVWSASNTWYPDVGDNHGLCDKDCGWCGHCADELGY